MKNTNGLSWGDGYVVQGNCADYLTGRVLTIIEALGLKETQEKSLKDLLRNEIYKIIKEEHGTLYIHEQLNNEIHRVLWEIKKIAEPMEIPMNGTYKFSITYTKEEPPQDTSGVH